MEQLVLFCDFFAKTFENFFNDTTSQTEFQKFHPYDYYAMLHIMNNMFVKLWSHLVDEKKEYNVQLELLKEMLAAENTNYCVANEIIAMLKSKLSNYESVVDSFIEISKKDSEHKKTGFQVK